MNQKIAKLAQEAGSVKFGGQNCLFSDAAVEAFARLIVEECAALAEAQSRVYTGENKQGDGCVAAAAAIRTGFKD